MQDQSVQNHLGTPCPYINLFISSHCRPLLVWYLRRLLRAAAREQSLRSLKYKTGIDKRFRTLWQNYKVSILLNELPNYRALIWYSVWWVICDALEVKLNQLHNLVNELMMHAGPTLRDDSYNHPDPPSPLVEKHINDSSYKGNFLACR